MHNQLLKKTSNTGGLASAHSTPKFTPLHPYSQSPPLTNSRFYNKKKVAKDRNHGLHRSQTFVEDESFITQSEAQPTRHNRKYQGEGQPYSDSNYQYTQPKTRIQKIKMDDDDVVDAMYFEDKYYDGLEGYCEDPKRKRHKLHMHTYNTEESNTYTVDSRGIKNIHRTGQDAPKGNTSYKYTPGSQTIQPDVAQVRKTEVQTHDKNLDNLNDPDHMTEETILQPSKEVSEEIKRLIQLRKVAIKNKEYDQVFYLKSMMDSIMFVEAVKKTSRK